MLMSIVLWVSLFVRCLCLLLWVSLFVIYFVLELAVESECDYIVSHNVKDFKDINKFNLKAITPQELLRKIGEIS